MNESLQKYTQLTQFIDNYTESVNIPNEEISSFHRIIDAAGRIIVTGTGTSMPTAQYLAARLQKESPAKPIAFLPTAKAIRACDTLTETDVVITISYGLNRADSLIILNKALRKCKTITISGNPSVQLADNLNIVIPPPEERIFCRPVSPLTTLVAIEHLVSGVKIRSMPRLNIADDLVKWIDPDKQTIILYAADVSFAAELWGIVLREGAGMNVSIKDMENYSHGYYGPDTRMLQNRQYIILKSNSSEDERDFSRAEGLYSIDGFNKYIITSPGATYISNAALFREVPEVIVKLLSRTGYDMYGPHGMDENRKYHEYEHYQDY